MRLKQKRQILQLVNTLFEAHNEIKKHLERKDNQIVLSILIDCQDAALKIGNTIERLEDDKLEVINYLVAYCELLYKLSNSMDSTVNYYKEIKILNKYLLKIKSYIKNNIEGKAEIVFLPYKASMWDSMESIWKAAYQDSSCSAYVVPIPYYDRESGGMFGKMHYEGNDLPEYVPIVDYKDYDIATREPDIIYFHNPFDQYNHITSVHPAFYSSNLKKYTDMLVYVPYFISTTYERLEAFANAQITTGAINANKIIAQSDIHKDMFVKAGLDEMKILVTGSPKADAALDMDKYKLKIPWDWQSKLQDKKVIILNSTIGSLLGENDYIVKLKKTIDKLILHDNIALIWRPHPLFEATILSMRPQFYDEYKNMILEMENSQNVILDFSSDAYTAMAISDGMISDLSSLACQYFITGKPVLMLDGKRELKNETMYIFDHFSCYFLHDGFSIENFCNMLLKGEDYLKDKRMEDLKKSIVNLDGTCGIKTHKMIIDCLM